MRHLIFVVGVLVCVTCKGESVRPYSVCEVLANLEKLNGQIIVVKGRLTFGQGVWLEGEKCPQVFRVGERTFDHLIAVEWPDSLIVEYELKGKTLFPLDKNGARLVEEASLADFSKTEFLATAEGMIVTRLPLTRLVHPQSPRTPLGYGHLGIAPAMVVVKKVIEVKIIEKPSASPLR